MKFMGNGGIFSTIYRKYGTFENHAKLTPSSVEGPHAVAENIFDWKNLTHGFYTKCVGSLTHESLQIDFIEPFYFESFRTMIFEKWRFNNNFIVKTSYKHSEYSIVHRHTDELCYTTAPPCSCPLNNEKIIFIERENVRLCDSIRFIVQGIDTYNTYSLVFSKLEIYGYHSKESKYCSCRKNHMFICIMILLL